MKTWILLIIISFSAFGEETFESRMAALNKELETEEMRARTKTRFQSFPNNKYVEEYNRVNEAHVQKVLNLHLEYCEKNQTNCLNDEQVKSLTQSFEDKKKEIEQKNQGKVTPREVATETVVETPPVEVEEKAVVPEVAPETKTETTTETKSEAVVTSSVDEESDPRNYDGSSCQWVTDLPRKIVNGPSCGKTRSRICTGYVICNQKRGEGRFVRMSTCRPDYCDDAVKCTLDRAYYSEKPSGEEKMFMSQKIKKAVSSEQ